MLNTEASKLLCELYPELSQYLDEKGRLSAEALRALYGCIESAKLWYDTITEKLLNKGYIQNPYDKCIFNKWHKYEKVQSTIGIHVDDCFMSCKNNNVLESIIEWFTAEFEELTVTRGLIHQFTGMTMDFRESEKLIITMKKHITELINSSGITGKSVSPADISLFVIDEKSPPLPEKWREKFHSLVYSALYIAKRVKPECLVVISVLASRVQHVTE